MMSDAARPWILTYTGQQFFYDEPERYAFTIDEIAHALSNCGRFAGHLRAFYSVAQHSLLVATIASRLAGRAPGALPGVSEKTIVRVALLHDASEAFLVDLPSPLKHMASLAGYRLIEQRIERAIYAAFGLLDAWSRSDVAALVKAADRTALAIEKRDLRPVPSRWEDADAARGAISEAVPACFTLEPAEPGDARVGFRKRWGESAPASRDGT